jgi:hypothetical protein
MLRRLFLLALSLLSLAAAAQEATEVPPFRAMPADKRARMEALRTSDPAELRKRWGALAHVAGKTWNANNGYSGGFEVHWVVEGAVAQLATFHCPRGAACVTQTALIHYRPPEGRTDAHFEIEWSNRSESTRGLVDDDDFYVYLGSFMNTARFRADPQTGVVKFGGIEHHVATAQELADFHAKGVDLQVHKAQRTAAARAAEEARVMAAREAEETRRRAADEAAARRQQEDDRQTALRAEAEARAEARLGAQRLRQAALREKFREVTPGEAYVAALKPAGAKKVEPDIILVSTDKPGRYTVEVAGDSFAPHVAVYDVSKPQPIAKATGTRDAVASLTFSVEPLASYVVMVHSADGGAGPYALRFAQ